MIIHVKRSIYSILLVIWQLSSHKVSIMIINVSEVERIEKTLASDEMQGRRTFSPGIDKAADFIADEFKKSGFATWITRRVYLQDFSMLRPKLISATGLLMAQPLMKKISLHLLLNRQ